MLEKTEVLEAIARLKVNTRVENSPNDTSE